MCIFKNVYLNWQNLLTITIPVRMTSSGQTWHHAIMPKNTKNINCVPKRANLPNLPQAQPIEIFWGILKYADGWEANSEKQLRMCINKKLKKVTIDVIQEET